MLGENKPSVLEHGQQLSAELRRSAEALLHLIENGSVDDASMRNAIMSKLTEINELLLKTEGKVKAIEAGEAPKSNIQGPDAVERFVHFSDEFVGEVEQEASDLRQKEELYRNGDMTEEEYRIFSDERVQMMNRFEDKITEHARPIHVERLREIIESSEYPEDSIEKNEARRMLQAFDFAHEFLIKKLAPMIELHAEDRLALFGEHLEHQYLSYKRAYDEILTRYELQRAAHHLGKASLSDVQKAWNDVRAAWEEKRTAYRNVSQKVLGKKGFTSEEIEELLERARDILRPEAPLPLNFEGENVTAVPVEEELETVEPMLTLEEFDTKMVEIKDHVLRWRDISATLERAGKLTPDVCAELLGELHTYEEKIQELAQNAENPEDSEEKRNLEAMIQRFRTEIEMSRDLQIDTDANGSFIVPPEKKIVGVAEARDAYQRVVAAYTSVQHTLSVDERRELRVRIACMSNAVRQAELQHAVAHATEHAPALAHATLASMPAVIPTQAAKSRGVWGVLGSAFRLK